MNKVLRIGFHFCILLALGVFVGCSDDEAPPPPVVPEPPHPAGSIGVYADAGGSDAIIVDSGGYQMLYVVHKAELGAKASEFSVEAPTGWTWLGEQSPYLKIGEAQYGISIAYGDCYYDAINVLMITYLAPGNTPTGETFKVKPHFRIPEGIQVVDCNDVLLQDGIGLESNVILP